VLTLYSYIIAAVFTAFIAITSVNLAVFIRERNHVNDLFNLNYLIDKRGSLKTFSILNLEMLHHISINRTRYDQSNIFEGSRYDYYSALFKDDVNRY